MNSTRGVVLSLVLLTSAFSFGYCDGSMKVYSDVDYIEQEGDCVGLEVELSRTGNIVSGSLRDHQGPCDVPSTPLKITRFDPKTGQIAFEAIGGDQFGYLFTGNLSDGRLEGKFMSVSNELIRNKTADLEKNGSDISLPIKKE